MRTLIFGNLFFENKWQITFSLALGARAAGVNTSLSTLGAQPPGLPDTVRVSDALLLYQGGSKEAREVQERGPPSRVHSFPIG